MPESIHESGPRRHGPALEKAYVFILWLIPTLEKFPKSQRFLLGDRWRAGKIELDEVERRVGAWIAHAEHADTWRLRQAIFHGGLFDPAVRPSSRSG